MGASLLVRNRASMLALLVAGCATDPGEAATPARAPFVAGAVEGTDAVIAIVRTGPEVTAYVCGGVSSYASLSRWFEGWGTPGEPLVLTRDGLSLRLPSTWAEGAIDGTLVDATGTARSFHARVQPEEGIAGLYEATDSGCRTGVLAWYPEGAATPDVVGTWCSSGGLAEQVTPVRPVVVANELMRVRLGDLAGRRDLFVSAFRSRHALLTR